MQQFMCIHSFQPGSITQEQLEQFAQLAQRSDEVKGIQSFSNLSEGKAICIMEAEDKATLKDFFERNGMPYDSVTAIEVAGQGGQMRQLLQPDIGDAQWPAV